MPVCRLHCRCDPGNVNPAPGGVCQPCNVARSGANKARTACVCATGLTAVLFQAGALQQCVTPGLNCASIPQATVNIVGNNCTCVAGYTAQYGSNGRLQSCTAPPPPPSNSAVPDSAIAVSGTWTVIPVLANDDHDDDHDDHDHSTAHRCSVSPPAGWQRDHSGECHRH
jgi:hypothetical protein